MNKMVQECFTLVCEYDRGSDKLGSFETEELANWAKNLFEKSYDSMRNWIKFCNSCEELREAPVYVKDGILYSLLSLSLHEYDSEVGAMVYDSHTHVVPGLEVPSKIHRTEFDFIKSMTDEDGDQIAIEMGPDERPDGLYYDIPPTTPMGDNILFSQWRGRR